MGIVLLLYLFKVVIPEAKGAYQLNCSKANYIKEVINWCAINMGMPPKVKQLPNIIIRYYKHKKLLGVFNFHGKQISVYVNGHENLLKLTNTLIHEYQHFLDIRNTNDQKDYAKILENIGYEKHPFEIAARNAADKYEKSCINDMVQRGLISKS